MTKRQAERFLYVKKRRGIIISKDIHTYQCPTCGFWNIGHKSKFKGEVPDREPDGLTARVSVSNSRSGRALNQPWNSA